LSAADIAALVESGEISSADGLWALLHSEFLTDEQMRDAARHWALGVVHLWDAPPVVVQYLKSGDEELMGAAYVAACAAARTVVEEAADAATYCAYWAAYWAAKASYCADRSAYCAAGWATQAIGGNGDGEADQAMAAVEAEKIVYLLGVIEGKELSRA
jgi:hypothetical protein